MLTNCNLPPNLILLFTVCILVDQVSSKGNICNIDCEQERFDPGKDCVESGAKCQCIAHCCWAFDCRNWPVFAQCRKKCRVKEWNRFGPKTGSAKCDQYPCYDHYLMEWDLRNLEQPKQKNCVQHCCYAFNCKKYSGYCRELCAI